MALWIITAFFASFIKGLCGVGDAPIFSSILAFAHNNIDISPVSIISSLPTNIIMSVQNRDSLDRKVWLPMAALLIAGMVPGTILLKNADTGRLKLIFGIFIIIVGILMLRNELSPKKIKPSNALLIIVGILAGISSGLFGIGVLLIIYVSQTTEDMSGFKGNICAIFAVENTARIIMYLILGMFTASVLKRGLIIAPFVALGVFVGNKASSLLDEKRAKIVVMSVLILCGIALTISNLH